jgi:hypothetical protein
MDLDRVNMSWWGAGGIGLEASLMSERRLVRTKIKVLCMDSAVEELYKASDVFCRKP